MLTNIVGHVAMRWLLSSFCYGNGKYGKPVAKIVPYVEDKPKQRVIGGGKQLTNMSIEDIQKAIDEPLDEEIMALFYK